MVLQCGGTKGSRRRRNPAWMKTSKFRGWDSGGEGREVEEGKAGSPFSTVGGPRPHSRNRLQNVLFTWFEGAPFYSRVFFFFLFFFVCLFSRVLILFSHTFFFLFFLSFVLSSPLLEPVFWTGGAQRRCLVARCDFGTTFATSATVVSCGPDSRNEGTVVAGWWFVGTSFESFSQFRGYVAVISFHERKRKSLIASPR